MKETKAQKAARLLASLAGLPSSPGREAEIKALQQIIEKSGHRGASKRLLALAALPVTPERTDEMLKLQKDILSSEQHVSPDITAAVDAAEYGKQNRGGLLVPLQGKQICDTAEQQSEDTLVAERLISYEILLPFVTWLSDADGRGVFNKDAIVSRVVMLRHLVDPSFSGGASLRQLAAETGICRQMLSRAAGAIVDQLQIGNSTINEFQRAAKKTARKFSSITRNPPQKN